MVVTTKEFTENENGLNKALAKVAMQKFEKPDYDPSKIFKGKGMVKMKKMKGV